MPQGKAHMKAVPIFSILFLWAGFTGITIAQADSFRYYASKEGQHYLQQKRGNHWHDVTVGRLDLILDSHGSKEQKSHLSQFLQVSLADLEKIQNRVGLSSSSTPLTQETIDEAIQAFHIQRIVKNSGHDRTQIILNALDLLNQAIGNNLKGIAAGAESCPAIEASHPDPYAFLNKPRMPLTLPSEDSRVKHRGQNPVGTPCSRLFPDTLNEHDRKLAEKYLLYFLDRDGVFTLVGGLKPETYLVASWQDIFKTDEPQSSEERKAILNRIMKWASSGQQFYFSAHPGDSTFNGFAPAVVNIPATIEQYKRHRSYFNSQSLDLSTPDKVIEAAIRDSKRELKRDEVVNGLLYGFAHHAVLARVTGKLNYSDDAVESLDIPSYLGRGEFGYDVPAGHKLNSEDLMIKRESKIIVDYYTKLRDAYVDSEGNGAIELLRKWLDNGHGFCSAQIAWKKALEDNRSEEKAMYSAP